MAIWVPGRGSLLDRLPAAWAMQTGAQEVCTYKDFLQRAGFIFYKLSYRH